MSNGTNAFHHIEFHTVHPDQLVHLFVYTYGFRLVAKRTTLNYAQWLLRSNQCQLLISSVSDSQPESDMQLDTDHYDILTVILRDKIARSWILERDTVFNIALHVKSVASVLESNPDVQVLVSRRQAIDQNGTIEYACIKSCVGNVVHTLIDTSQYTGSFLPGFEPVSVSTEHLLDESLVSGIDHVAFAMPKHSAVESVHWYEKVLGMKRLVVNQNDDPFHGFSVRVGTMGMRLFASEYWKCAETACIQDKSSNLKFVFAESLIEGDSKSRDQITNFITQHQNQAGIQHVGFTCAQNIKDAVRSAKANGAQFLQPCRTYYLQDNNGFAIEAAGENADELAELGILLDDEVEAGEASDEKKRVLLQIFTKSIFNNDTFFLEFIERRGATGFGAGNVRTLWKIVQEQIAGRDR